MSSHDENKTPEEDFESLAAGRRQGLVQEFLGFIMANKKWWLLPLVVVILALGALVILGGSGFAPFIYTLF